MKSMQGSNERSSKNSADGKGKCAKWYKFRQFLATFIACIAPFTLGTVVGYTSSAIPDMKKDPIFEDLNQEAESLISSLMTAGALCGGLFAGFLTNYFGRKLVIILTCIPYVCGWLLIFFANNVIMLYGGRFVSGMCCGMTCLSVPLYIAEIASPEIRGILGASFQLFINAGITVAFVFGKYYSWKTLGAVLAIFPVAQMMLMTVVPESPFWLLQKKKKATSLAALSWLRGPHEDVASEYAEMESRQPQATKLVLYDYISPQSLKPLCVMILEMSIQQLSGINPVLFNAVTIFQTASQGLDSHDATIVVGCFMTVAAIVAFFLMDKAGRRILLLASGPLMGLSLAALGTYYIISDKTSILWLPVVSAVIYVTVFNLGFGPVPWVTMGEIFPRKVAGLGSSLVTTYTWGLAFVVSKTFFNLQDVIKTYGIFWFYGSTCIVGTILVYFFVPETKGLTLYEIEQQFQPELKREELPLAEPPSRELTQY